MISGMISLTMFAIATVSGSSCVYLLTRVCIKIRKTDTDTEALLVNGSSESDDECFEVDQAPDIVDDREIEESKEYLERCVRQDEPFEIEEEEKSTDAIVEISHESDNNNSE